MVLNDEEDLKRQQAAERARDREERLRDAYVSCISRIASQLVKQLITWGMRRHT